MSTTTQPPKPKRRWLRFSLAMLLVVVTLFIVGIGWVGSRMQQARLNRERFAAVEESVAAIEKLGGEVTSYYELLRPHTWLEEQFDDPGGDDDPVGVFMVTDVVLWDADADVTAALKHVNGLKGLQSLDLSGTNVTDADLTYLKGLNRLRSLYFPGTNVTDAGLEHLKGLEGLEYLDLSDFNFRDLSGAKITDVSAANITDAGLVYLKGLTNLRTLNLDGTNVTDEGVKKLQKALPKCEIVTSSFDLRPLTPSESPPPADLPLLPDSLPPPDFPPPPGLFPPDRK